jgi:hypothetical protein
MRGVLLCAALLLTACDSGTDPTAAPSAAGPTTAATPSPTWKPPADPAGVRACDAVKKANAANAFEPEVAALQGAGEAGKGSTNNSVRISSGLLASAAQLAVAANGQSDEPVMKIRLGTAALNLETACMTAGYYPKPS